ncbi:Oligo-1,6-glucosidase [Roseivivax sp. THAF40]|uniref:alpha-amylase family glycosyl hydrolase n=1 Tax=unclassified Roseivivax TaxID=2639302 RepID=UPI0012687E26|nr:MULTISPECIES: alpha-amylase family glycosyl hydrolase [unclassified Roseivivax]QFS82288.1 Oligo-1,6-glucosidase [Roseivivax sp. THAF197b]QFT46088.1 Oligo-1,6-glucosidase [Roseivivax sp. THAF40]
MSEWWKDGVIYQIYPRSFQDTNGDGVGDLRGIEARLDHLVDLGVDAAWISPIFPSPMKDAGYDVSDYTGIDPTFGTLEDFESLIAAAEARGLKVLLDFVPSHTSDQHPWFIEACASKDSPKRDWYVWRDPKPDGSPPTNWISEFAGPAWTFHEATGQYYMHIFLTEQPSLNWHNPELRAAMYDVMRTWFDRGVDGFRVDAVENMVPNPEAGDNPPNPEWVESMGPARSHLGTNTKHQPEIFDIAREMRAVAEEYDPPRLLVGEAYGETEQVMKYYGDALDAFQQPFNFMLIETEWEAENLATLIGEYEAALPEGAWPNWVLGNHDRSRIASRIGPERARAAALMLLSLRGTPTIYQGEELGMENVPIPPDRVQDPWEKNVPGHGLGRDPVRTPIAWEDARHGGFSEVDPWLPMDLDPARIVENQTNDPASMLAFYRRLLALRREREALRRGALEDLRAEDGVLFYTRRAGDDVVHVAINWGESPVDIVLPGQVVLATDEVEVGALAPGSGRMSLG